MCLKSNNPFRIRTGKSVAIFFIILIVIGFSGICMIPVLAVIYNNEIDTYFKDESIAKKATDTMSEEIDKEETEEKGEVIEEISKELSKPEILKINIFGYIVIAIPVFLFIAGMALLFIQKNRINKIVRGFYNDFLLYLRYFDSENEDYVENLISSISKLKMISNDEKITDLIEKLINPPENLKVEDLLKIFKSSKNK